MRDPHVDSESVGCVVRADWLYLLSGECQRIIGAIEFGEPGLDPIATAHDLILRIPDPVTAIEERLLRGNLLELAVWWAAKAHQRIHAGDVASCRFRADAHVHDAWRLGSRPSKRLFEDWCAGYFAALGRAHPDRAVEAARWLEAHSGAPLHVRAVARAMGLHEVALRRAFRARYGMSMREYHVRARLERAVALHCEGACDARSALFEAGWSSPKNFYRAARQVTGMSVRQLRALPPERLARAVALPEPRLTSN